jgi:hypothetical protein
VAERYTRRFAGVPPRGKPSSWLTLVAYCRVGKVSRTTLRKRSSRASYAPAWSKTREQEKRSESPLRGRWRLFRQTHPKTLTQLSRCSRPSRRSPQAGGAWNEITETQNNAVLFLHGKPRMTPYLESFPDDSEEIQAKIRHHNYGLLLTSPEWDDLRIACLAQYFPNQAPYVCLSCGNLIKSRRVAIHHLRYPTRSDPRKINPVRDLIPICGSCHELVRAFPPESGVHQRGLTPELFRQRMQAAFRSRRQLKRFRKQTRVDAEHREKDVAFLLGLGTSDAGGRQHLPSPVDARERLWARRHTFRRWLKDEGHDLDEESCRLFLEAGPREILPHPVADDIDSNRPCVLDTDDLDEFIADWKPRFGL